MRNNINVAREYAETQSGLTNGIGDALRHTLWSALDATDIGLVKAREFHTLHETSNPDRSNAMDLHNNNNNNNTMTVHEVVIVEYNEWNYRIADSLTGQYIWISRDLITVSNGAYEIVGTHQ